MTGTKEITKYQREDILARASSALKEGLGYSEIREIMIEGQPCVLATQNGQPMVVVFAPEQEGPIRPIDEEVAQELGAVVENGPAAYVWATSTGVQDEGYIYCWLPDQECQISALPRAHQGKDRAAPSIVVSRKKGALEVKKLQQEFDDLHEFIYVAKEPVDSSNDITANLCKCIFLKMHLEHNRDFRVYPDGPLFESVFDGAFIRNEKEKAVDLIRKAFDTAKNSDSYKLKDDKGNTFDIFDQQDFIKFRKPETYARIADFLNAHQLSAPEESGLEDDIIGRAFDVMLRAKFEGKGGMGVYLTPQQVRDAMVQMAFHDILSDDPGVITRQDPETGRITFRMCDLCCGSAGFIVTAMREVRKQVKKLLGLDEVQQAALLKQIYSEGFEGADNAPGQVLMARINMALHGDPKARVFLVDNSLTADLFLPETFDLILTNPPFKKGGVTLKDNGDMLSFFQSDIQGGVLQMKGDRLAMGAKPNSKQEWKPVNSVDPAVLFIDRCLQLLKPGGRLLIVLPDGILCNSGDRYVREYIMGEKDNSTARFLGGKAVVKAVVSLPPATFRLSGAGAKTSFLYLQKKRPGDEQGPVFMAVADHVGFDVKQNKEVLIDQNDLVKIVEAYKQGPDGTGAAD